MWQIVFIVISLSFGEHAFQMLPLSFDEKWKCDYWLDNHIEVVPVGPSVVTKSGCVFIEKGRRV